MTTAAPRIDYVVYDGTNSAAVLALAELRCSQPVSIASEADGVLVMNCQDNDANPFTTTFNTGDLAAVMPGQWCPSPMSQVQMDAAYVTVVP